VKKKLHDKEKSVVSGKKTTNKIKRQSKSQNANVKKKTQTVFHKGRRSEENFPRKSEFFVQKIHFFCFGHIQEYFSL
jgi:hypothetical protein